MNKILKILTINLGLVFLAASGFADDTVRQVYVPSPDKALKTIEIKPGDVDEFKKKCQNNNLKPVTIATYIKDGIIHTISCSANGAGPGIINESVQPFAGVDYAVYLINTNAKVGVGTTDPASELDVAGNLQVDTPGGLVAIEVIDTPASTTRLLIDTDLGGLRSGNSGGDDAWDFFKINTSQYSFASGLNNTVQGSFGTAFGENNVLTVHAINSFVAGGGNYADGEDSAVLGSNNSIGSGGAYSINSIGMGDRLIMDRTGDNATAFGRNIGLGYAGKVIAIGARDGSLGLPDADNFIALANKTVILSSGADGGNNPSNMSLIVTEGIRVEDNRFVPTADKLINEAPVTIDVSAGTITPLGDVTGFQHPATGDFIIKLAPGFCGDPSYKPSFTATAQSTSALIPVLVNIISSASNQIHFNTTKKDSVWIDPAIINGFITCKRAVAGQAGY